MRKLLATLTTNPQRADKMAVGMMLDDFDFWSLVDGRFRKARRHAAILARPGDARFYIDNQRMRELTAPFTNKQNRALGQPTFNNVRRAIFLRLAPRFDMVPGSYFGEVSAHVFS